MTNNNSEQAPDGKIDWATLDQRMRPIRAAYAGKSDAELWHEARRKLLIAAGLCAEVTVITALDGAIASASDKIGAFIEKAASGLSQIKAPLADSAPPYGDAAHAHEPDPLADAIAAWSGHSERRAD